MLADGEEIVIVPDDTVVDGIIEMGNDIIEMTQDIANTLRTKL